MFTLLTNAGAPWRLLSCLRRCCSCLCCCSSTGRLKGFCVLIAKDWLSFGHRFRERLGHASRSGRQSTHVSPIFLQVHSPATIPAASLCASLRATLGNLADSNCFDLGLRACGVSACASECVAVLGLLLAARSLLPSNVRVLPSHTPCCC